MQYYNPFSNLELRIPEIYKDKIDSYCQTQPSGGRRPSPDDSPFKRQVDFWFLAVCLGAKRGSRTNNQKWHKFITGEILSREPERIVLLELLAISVTNDPWIVGKPNEVIQLANELAATGIPEVISMLERGNSKSIWNLTDNILELV